MTPLSPADIDEIRSCARAMADAARIATLRYFRSPDLLADNKVAAGFDPVTAGDRASEAAMRQVLAERRPQDAIFGEEEAAKGGSSGLTWVIDPIDGTRSYLIGTPTWTVLIGLRNAERCLYGLINQPLTGESWEGGFGIARHQGAQGERTLRCSTRRTLAEARLVSTYTDLRSPEANAAFARVAREVKLVRHSLDGYGYALVAMGSVDLVIEAGLQSYDVMAPIGVIEAAGGIVTDWRGRSALDGGQILAAANAELHRAALDRLGAAGG